MIRKSKSAPYNLYKLVEKIPRSNSFCDYHNLFSSGTTYYKSYGLFLLKNPNASRSQRREAIQHFYYNKI